MKSKSKAKDGLLTKEQLCERLNVDSTDFIDGLMASRKISYLRLGHRTVRFDWEKVQRELARLEVKAVGS